MFEWLESARVAQNIRDLEQAGRGCIHILQEGWGQKSLPIKVLDALGPCPDSFQTLGDYEPKVEKKASSGAILYKVSDDTGSMETTEVARGPGIDKNILETDDMYILDFEDSIMMWQGKTAKESEMAEAMQKAMEFLVKSGRSFRTQVTVFPQGREPKMFTVHFKNWDKSKYCAFDSADLYKKRAEEVEVEESIPEPEISLKLEKSQIPVKKPRCLSKIATPKVPEALAKKRARYAKLNAQRETQKAVEKAYNLQNRREFVEKARIYAQEYKTEKKALENNKKAAKAVGNFYVPDEPKLALVIRIRGINQLSPKPKKTLQLLRLRQIGNAVFVKLNKASLEMLRIVEPFVTWGYPSVDTIKKMIYKRGAVKINGQRIKISDNCVVEKSVGKYGVTCVEDLVHEIYTVGENFKQVNNSLYPVKLSCPRGGWRKVTNHFIEGGDFGNREDYINDLVKKMN